MGNYYDKARTLVGFSEASNETDILHRARKRKRDFVEHLNDEEESESLGSDDEEEDDGEEEEEEEEMNEYEDESAPNNDSSSDSESSESNDEANSNNNNNVDSAQMNVNQPLAADLNSTLNNDDDATNFFIGGSSTSNQIVSIRNLLNSTSTVNNEPSSSSYSLLANRSISHSINNAATSPSPPLSSNELTPATPSTPIYRSPSAASSPSPNKISFDLNKSSKKTKKTKLLLTKLRTPNKQKMKSTSHYIYNTLFVRGENSDIVVKALNKEWRLHKIYIMQSPYFQSMFKGAKWRESQESYIEIAIPDENISEKALFISFGSFYKEDLELIPLEVVSVLACASLFSLDGLINQCAQVMLDNLNYKTVIQYYDASILYGVQSVTEKAFKWLANNLMTNTEIKLSEISLCLFDKLLASNDLIILQVETDLYTLCKKWLYFQFNNLDDSKSNKTDAKGWQKLFNEFFKAKSVAAAASSSHAAETAALPTTSSEIMDTNESDDVKCDPNAPKYFLNDLKYRKYSCIFKKIRLQHIIADLSSIKVLVNDQIIPRDWVEPLYRKNWLNTLHIDQDQLSNDFEMTRVDFDRECFRFGRMLNDDNTANWRWVNFFYNILFFFI